MRGEWLSEKVRCVFYFRFTARPFFYFCYSCRCCFWFWRWFV
nr:MAG TPA: hypothetical protein [Inoviridae sp.]